MGLLTDKSRFLDCGLLDRKCAVRLHYWTIQGEAVAS